MRRRGRHVRVGTSISRREEDLVEFPCLPEAAGRHPELVPPMPAPLVALGPEGCQHALAPVLISGTEPLEIAGGEAPARDLAPRMARKLEWVALSSHVALVTWHVTGYSASG